MTRKINELHKARKNAKKFVINGAVAGVQRIVLTLTKVSSLIIMIRFSLCHIRANPFICRHHKLRRNMLGSNDILPCRIVRISCGIKTVNESPTSKSLPKTALIFSKTIYFVVCSAINKVLAISLIVSSTGRQTNPPNNLPSLSLHSTSRSPIGIIPPSNSTSG